MDYFVHLLLQLLLVLPPFLLLLLGLCQYWGLLIPLLVLHSMLVQLLLVQFTLWCCYTNYCCWW